MTTPIASIDNTTLLNLTPNLDIGDVADPALRLAYFQYLNVYIQSITTAFNAFVANGAVGTVNLADLSVTTAKIALLAVTAAQIANETITTTQILNETLLNIDISPSAAIDWTKISKTGSNLTDLATRLITDLTGILAAAQFPALTGDITTVAGTLATILKNTGIAGTYKSVTTDAQGRVTGGTNPTTISGFGITDAAPLTHVGSNGLAQHALADSTNAGFLSSALSDKLIGLQTTGLVGFAVPVGQVLSLFARYSQEQDAVTGELVFYEI